MNLVNPILTILLCMLVGAVAGLAAILTSPPNNYVFVGILIGSFVLAGRTVKHFRDDY